MSYQIFINLQYKSLKKL